MSRDEEIVNNLSVSFNIKIIISEMEQNAGRKEYCEKFQQKLKLHENVISNSSTNANLLHY